VPNSIINTSPKSKLSIAEKLRAKTNSIRSQEQNESVAYGARQIVSAASPSPWKKNEDDTSDLSDEGIKLAIEKQDRELALVNLKAKRPSVSRPNKIPGSTNSKAINISFGEEDEINKLASNIANEDFIFESNKSYLNSVSESAHKSWAQYMQNASSIISDIFSGQFQSTIECLTCGAKSNCFDPFIDISLPIPKTFENDSKNKSLTGLSFSWKQSGSNDSPEKRKCSLEDCLKIFTTDEILDEENMYFCEKCKLKSKCLKKLFIYRFPEVLILQIKRFKSNSFEQNTSSEKLTTDIAFPINGLDLTPYTSPDSYKTLTDQYKISPIYDLCSVSHHQGSLHGGHYIAHVDIKLDNGQPRWVCFNDDQVDDISPNNISGPSAYVLFYKIRHRKTESI